MPAAEQLERYRRIRALASGGMSTIVLAEDTLLGRRVALKRLHPMGDARGVSRLRREALIGASVSHPNLVPIYDIITGEDGEHVIVMEYVEGETLRDAIQRQGRLAVPLALRILEGVAAALDAIHAQRIVHRDVKPANILLGADGTIKLADLGVASAPDQTRITTEGGVVGTFSYMAPEQLSGARATPAIDVYALAAVAFEALSGRKARTEPNPLALAHAIASGPPPDLREAWPDAPASAAKLLIRGMSRRPTDRPRSAGELTARLRAALIPEATVADAPLPAPQRPAARRPPARAAAAVAPPAVGRPPASARPAAAKPAPAPANRAEVPAKPASAPAKPAGIPAKPAEAPAKAAEAPAKAADAPPKAAEAPATPAAAPRTDPPERPRDAASAVDRRRRRILAAALIPAVAVIAAVVAIAASGGSTPGRHAQAGSTTPHAGAAGSPTTPRPAGSSTSGNAGAGAQPSQSGSGAGVPSSPVATGPVSTVERFYTLAAGHSYPAAWALADPAFRDQLGGYGGFQATMAGSRSITFNSARTVSQSGSSATVAIQTTSVRTNGTQHCSGTVRLVPSGSGWLLHQIGISCV